MMQHVLQLRIGQTVVALICPKCQHQCGAVSGMASRSTDAGNTAAWSRTWGELLRRINAEPEFNQSQGWFGRDEGYQRRDRNEYHRRRPGGFLGGLFGDHD